MKRHVQVRSSIARKVVITLTMWVICAGSSQAQPARDGGIDLPETPAGRCAAAYLEAFNAGADQIREFTQKYRMESYLQKNPIEGIVERYGVIREAAGELTPVRILGSTDNKIILVARTSQGQVNIEFQFVVEEQPPHRLIVFTLQQVGALEPEADSVPIDDEIIRATIEAVAEILRDGYVYPDKGKSMSDMLLRNYSKNRYAGIREGGALARRITDDLQALSGDNHLNVRHGTPTRPHFATPGTPRKVLPGARKQIEWPDTPAGCQAEAYFDVYNTGSNDDLRRFIREHFSDVALKERSPEEWFAFHSGMRSMAGSVTFHSAKADGPFAVEVSLNAEKTGWARLLIDVSPKPPHGLMSFDDMTPSGEDVRSNYGFRKVEVLPNNIGYIRFDQCHHSEEARETAAAALAFVANCDALIFDVRHNGGGTRHMTQFIGGYLFDKPVHIGGKYSRLTDEITEWSTFAEIPGRRFGPEVPVYVLTSSMTFSAAETFAYWLQDLKRVTVVGETTGGGAHPVHERVVNDRFWMRLPSARAISPVSKTDWEGVGVIPDIKVPASESLEAAVADAIKRIRRN